MNAIAQDSQLPRKTMPQGPIGFAISAYQPRGLLQLSKLGASQLNGAVQVVVVGGLRWRVGTTTVINGRGCSTR
jgi:hypothetical protein